MNSSKLLLVLLSLIALSAIGVAVWMTLDSSQEDESSIDSGVEHGEEDEGDSAERSTQKDASKSDRLEVSRESLESAGSLEAVTDGQKVAESNPLGFHGKVLDEAGNPIAGASVTVRKKTNGYFWGPEDDGAKTDDNGHYRIFGLDPKTPYILEAIHPEYVKGKTEAGTLAEGLEEVDPVTLAMGAAVEGTVYDPSGTPLQGASVWAREIQEKPGTVMEYFDFDEMFSQSRHSSTTNAKGHFRLSGLAPSKPLKIYAKAAECDQASVGPYEITKGQTRRDLLFRLQAGKSVAGVVVSESGPVSNAEVALETWGSPFDDSEEAQTLEPIKTDAQGRFMFAQVAKGSYSLTVKSPDFADFLLRSVKPGATDLVITLKRMGRARGIVRSEGAPVTEFSLRVASMRGEGRLGRFKDIEDVDGAGNDSFELQDLAPGSYVLSVRAIGFAKTQSSTIEISAGETTEGIVIDVKPEATLKGTVVSALTGEAVPGARVRTTADVESEEVDYYGEMALLAPGGSEFMPQSGGEDFSITDDEGRFEISGLGSGLFKLRVTHEDFVKMEMNAIELLEGVTHSPIELRLAEGGSVVGMVRDRNGDPKAGVRVVAKSEGDGRESKSARTDTEGFYRIEHLEPGPYRVSNQRGGHGEMVSFDSTFVSVDMVGDQEASGKAVVIEEGQEATIDFDENNLGFLSGRVSFQGSNVAEARVELHKDGNFGSVCRTQSDASGEFHLEGAPPSTYRLQVSHPMGTIPFSMEIDLVSGDLNQNVELPGGIIRGKVEDQDGQPMPGVRVSLKSTKGDRSSMMSAGLMLLSGDDDFGGMSQTVFVGGSGGQIKTDEAGRYEVLYVPAGTYEINVQHKTAVPKEKPIVELERDQVKDGVDAEMILGATLSGLLKLPDGKPATEAWMYLSEKDGSETYTSQIDKDGSYEIAGIQSGTYNLQASSFTGSENFSTEIVIESGDKITKDITLQKE